LTKRRWTCETVERSFTRISAAEMRQRLAETLDLLLTPSSQLPIPKAFSRQSRFRNRDPRLVQTKRKGPA
jgi:hypothetical protein